MYEEEQSSYSSAYRQYSRDTLLESREFQVEKKFLRLEVCENERGRFLRIIEENQRRRNTVIIPDSGFSDFSKSVVDLLSPNDQS